MIPMGRPNLRLRNAKASLACQPNNLQNRNPALRITKCSQALISLNPLKLDHHLGSANHDPLDLPVSCPELQGEGRKRITDTSIFKSMDHPFNKQRTSKLGTATGKKLKRRPSKAATGKAGRKRHHKKSSNKRNNHFKGVSSCKNDTAKAVALSNLIQSAESNKPDLVKSTSSSLATSSNGLIGGRPALLIRLRKAIAVKDADQCRTLLDQWLKQGNDINDGVNDESQTLVHFALLNDSLKCVDVLIENGADASTKDTAGSCGLEALDQLMAKAFTENDKAKIVELFSLGADEGAKQVIEAIIYRKKLFLQMILSEWKQYGKDVASEINAFGDTFLSIARLISKTCAKIVLEYEMDSSDSDSNAPLDDLTQFDDLTLFDDL